MHIRSPHYLFVLQCKHHGRFGLHDVRLAGRGCKVCCRVCFAHEVAGRFIFRRASFQSFGVLLWRTKDRREGGAARLVHLFFLKGLVAQAAEPTGQSSQAFVAFQAFIAWFARLCGRFAR